MEAGGNAEEANKGGSGSDQDLSMEEILQSIRRIIAEDDGDKKADDATDEAAAPAADTKSTEEKTEAAPEADEKPAEEPKADAPQEETKPAAEATEEAPKEDAKADDASSSDEVPGSDVLELTEMLQEDGSVVNVNEEEPKEEAPLSNDVLAKINEALSDPDAEKKEAAPAEEKPAEEPVKEEVKVEAAPQEEAPATPAKSESLLSEEAASAASSQFKRLGVDLEEDVHVPSPPFRSGTTVEALVIEMLRPMMKEWLDANLPPIVERIVEREVKKLTK